MQGSVLLCILVQTQASFEGLILYETISNSEHENSKLVTVLPGTFWLTDGESSRKCPFIMSQTAILPEGNLLRNVNNIFLFLLKPTCHLEPKRGFTMDA